MPRQQIEADIAMSRDTDQDDRDDIWDEYEAKAEKARQRRMWAHPDCRDPDHPGCSFCEINDEED